MSSERAAASDRLSDKSPVTVGQSTGKVLYGWAPKQVVFTPVPRFSCPPPWLSLSPAGSFCKQNAWPGVSKPPSQLHLAFVKYLSTNRGFAFRQYAWRGVCKRPNQVHRRSQSEDREATAEFEEETVHTDKGVIDLHNMSLWLFVDFLFVR